MFLWICCKIIFLFLLWCSFTPCVVVFHLLFFVGLDLRKDYFLKLALSWNILFSPSMVIESFVRYRSLGWHSCSLEVE